MKETLFFVLTFLFLGATSLAQDYTRMSLPDGAKARIGKASIIDVKYSSDGTRLAVASTIGVWLYDTNRYREIALLSGHTWEISAMTFSPDENVLATASYDDPVRLWDTRTGELRTVLPGYVNLVEGLAFSPDGNILAIANEQEIFLWDVETVERQAVLQAPAGRIIALTFSSDGKTLVSASLGETIQIWDVDTAQLLATYEISLGNFSQAVLSKENRILASVIWNDRRIKLWDIHTGQLRATLSGHKYRIDSLAFSPDGTMFASGGAGWDNAARQNLGEILLWNASTGGLRKTFTIPTVTIKAVTFSPDGKTLVSASSDKIWFWEMQTGALQGTVEGYTPGADAIAFSPDGETLASGSGNEVRLWDAQTGEHRAKLAEHWLVVKSLAFSPDGELLASGSGEEAIISHVETGRQPKWLSSRSNWSTPVAFSPDGKTLAIRRFSGSIWLRDRDTGELQRALGGKEYYVEVQAFSPDGKTLATAGSDGEIWLWNVKTGELQDTRLGNTDRIYSLAFSPDGKMLASTGRNETIRLWDAETGRLREVLSGHRAPVYAIAFSPDGCLLASGSGDATIRLWDVDSRCYRATLLGHSDGVSALAFSPDGRTLSSGSWDGSILLWELPLSPSAFVSITPSVMEAPPVEEQIQVNVDIRGGQSVRGYELTVAFDSSALRYVSAINGDYLPGNCFFVPPIVRQNRVTVVATSPNGVGDGDGTLATLTFEVVARKTSNIVLFEVMLSDSSGEALPIFVKSGWMTEPRWDVNFDGYVNIQDLALVASRFGRADFIESDINGDGVVDIADLVLVASGLDAAAGAPSQKQIQIICSINPTEIERWIRLARQYDGREKAEPMFQQGVAVLGKLLAILTTTKATVPTQTVLFPNYPNPFNPETWIAYQLAEAADVTLTVYDANGKVVRRLIRAHQLAGMYYKRGRAAYWNGRNAFGERVASGLYFYTLTTGEFTATRRMLIRK